MTAEVDRRLAALVVALEARVDPEAVRGFVAAHGDELSGPSRREALEHL